MKRRVKSDLKLFFMLLLIIFGFVTNIFAGNININDCNRLNYVPDHWPYEDVLPKSHLEIAIKNLKSFCCSTSRIKKDVKQTVCDTLELSEQYAESPYLFDHLVDVGLRKLDAESDGAYDGMTFDEKGEERRKIINEFANLKNGVAPVSFKTAFDTYFKFGNVYSADNFNENFKDYTLYERYINRCDISNELYGEIVGNDNKIMQMKPGRSGLKKCKKLVQNRVQAEIDYVNILMLERANDILGNSMKTYLNDYFVQDKRLSLSDSFVKLENSIFIMNKLIGANLTKECSK